MLTRTQGKGTLTHRRLIQTSRECCRPPAEVQVGVGRGPPEMGHWQQQSWETHLGWVGVLWEVPEAPVQSLWASLEAQRVKRLPAMTWVRSLGGEDPPGEGNAKPLYSPWGCKESDTTEQLHSLTHRACRLQDWVTSGQTANRKGAQPHPSTDNWSQVLLSTTPPTRARPSYSHSQSLPSGSLHSLIHIHQRADRRNKNYNPRSL